MSDQGRVGLAITPFAFREMGREVTLGQAIELGKAAFEEAPECLNAIDVNLAMGEGFF